MKNITSIKLIKVNGESMQSKADVLAVEEPLEIRLKYGSPAIARNIAVTMRTPGHDAELAAGFLFTEGIITGPAAINKIEHVFVACSENKENSIEVLLNGNIIPNLSQAERNFYTTSSCGVCGKASINAIKTVSAVVVQPWNSEPILPALLTGLPEKLHEQQKVFAATGGLHAAAIFDKEGKLLLLREDVGRHNAVDKLIGAALPHSNINLTQSILLLSGRASFELVQKAAMAGIPVIAAVGAPSSLAVSLATSFGITLVGFLRSNHFNIYSAAHRIQLPVHENSY